MIDFFKSTCVSTPAVTSPPPLTATNLSDIPVSSPEPGLKYEKIYRGYMDDPLNTDQAWKEVELWHFHYTSQDNLSEKMNPTQVNWRIITEDIFIKLPAGQATLLQEVTNKLQVSIL